MKRNIILLILIASPLMGQEKSERKNKEYKRPVFALNYELGSSMNLPMYKSKYITAGLKTGISTDFYLGKKFYFFLQFNLGYRDFFNAPQINNFIFMHGFSSFYFGGVVGFGGYIKEATITNPWSVVMNGGVGGALLFKKVAKGKGYNRTNIGLFGEGIHVYLDILGRYRINNIYSVQFGPVFTFTAMFPTPSTDLTFKVGLAF